MLRSGTGAVPVNIKAANIYALLRFINERKFLICGETCFHN